MTLLQTRVQDLEHQLQEAQRDHRLMTTSLSATQLELQDQSVRRPIQSFSHAHITRYILAV